MTAPLRHVRHLTRRFLGALSDAAPRAADDAWAVGFLNIGESELWWQMQAQDRRHSIAVARRLMAEAAEVPTDVMAAALLHDVGKIASRLGTFGRVGATVLGPRTDRFRRYHDHERLGAELLTAAGSTERTRRLVAGSANDETWSSALQRADDV